jgi:hypothetical protein
MTAPAAHNNLKLIFTRWRKGREWGRLDELCDEDFTLRNPS